MIPAISPIWFSFLTLDPVMEQHRIQSWTLSVKGCRARVNPLPVTTKCQWELITGDALWWITACHHFGSGYADRGKQWCAGSSEDDATKDASRWVGTWFRCCRLSTPICQAQDVATSTHLCGKTTLLSLESEGWHRFRACARKSLWFGSTRKWFLCFSGLQRICPKMRGYCNTHFTHVDDSRYFFLNLQIS